MIASADLINIKDIVTFFLWVPFDSTTNFISLIGSTIIVSYETWGFTVCCKTIVFWLIFKHFSVSMNSITQRYELIINLIWCYILRNKVNYRFYENDVMYIQLVVHKKKKLIRFSCSYYICNIISSYLSTRTMVIRHQKPLVLIPGNETKDLT